MFVGGIIFYFTSTYFNACIRLPLNISKKIQAEQSQKEFILNEI
jgi:hypothetical protein